MSNDQTFTQPWTTDATADIDLNAAFQDPHFFEYASSIRPQDNQSTHGRVISLDRVPDMSAIQQTDIPPAGTLVRRNPHQQVAARRLAPWGDSFQHREQGEIHNMEDDDEELEQKALLARKDAQSKRKQIPPFVQKLSRYVNITPVPQTQPLTEPSFLDDNKNTNLIRWSDDGNSFIVLDEDEFARTLIPELFKHNNYASFVRQLNMYGFHKKVGLSDNSMKASEMKAKAPSEYYNKYFKRGRPELLWLIQKPKNAAAAKRKREDETTKGDSDEERKYMPDTGGGAHYPEDLAIRGHADMTMIPRLEYNNLRNEVRHLQQQQKAISNVLTTIRRQNDELYQQANNFRQLHERHENSINAILTFLATFYDRSLQNGTGNLTDLFHPMQNQQPHGNVVDVDEYPEKAFEKPANQMQMQRSFRKPNLLLPAPVAKDAATRPGRAATLSPSVLSAGGSPISKPTSKPVFRAPPGSTRSNSGSTGASSRSGTTGVPNHNQSVRPKADSPVTTPSGSLPENSEIMSAIQSANANASASNSAVPGPHFDIPAALANYTAQGGMGPLTPQQRNDVLSLMASNASGASANPSNPTSSTFDIQNSNNAMVNPHPPTMPDLSHYMESRAQLEMLQKLSDEQESRVQSLQERLQPLSPSGSIPHLGSDGGGYFGAAAMGGLSEPGSMISTLILLSMAMISLRLGLRRMVGWA